MGRPPRDSEQATCRSAGGARPRRRAGPEAVDRLARLAGHPPGGGRAVPSSPPGGGRAVPSVTSIRFHREDSEWREDSSVSGDSSCAGSRRNVETTLIRAPSAEQLRVLDGSGGPFRGRRDEDRDPERGDEWHLSHSFYTVAAHGAAVVPRPAHWATAEEVAREDGARAAHARMPRTASASSLVRAMRGALASPEPPRRDPARGDAPRPGAGGAGGSVASSEDGDDDVLSATSSQLWDRLEGDGARGSRVVAPRESARAGPRTARGEGRARRVAPAAWRCAAIVVALIVLAVVGVAAAGYLVSDDDHPWLEFLLVNNFLGRVAGRDGGAGRREAGPSRLLRRAATDAPRPPPW